MMSYSLTFGQKRAVKLNRKSMRWGRESGCYDCQILRENTREKYDDFVVLYGDSNGFVLSFSPVC